MIRNYWKVAVRYLMRNKGYTAINVLGLTIGTACCVLIMLFVRSEWSYDRFNHNAAQIYRLWQQEKGDAQEFINTATPLSAAGVIQASYPEVESTCRVFGMNPIIKVNQNSFTDNVRMVDSTLFRIFDFDLIQGDKSNPFPTANSVILTTETARKYFGSENAMGKTVEIQLGNDKILFTVSGIAKKPPETSSIKFNVLVSYGVARSLFGPGAFKSWFNVQSETFVMLKKGVNADILEKKFPAMIRQYLGEDYHEGKFLFHLQPITDIHLNNALPAGNEPVSNPKYSYILATIGFLVLLLACINFILLSMGRSTTRALEVGVRKTMGAGRQQLIRQFWGEAMILTLASVIVGIAVAYFLVSPFDQIVQRQLSLHIDFGFILFCIGIIAIVALIAGMYPAIILSGFRPVEVLKGKLKMKGNSGWLTRSLIVGQFVASIGMIICTLAVGHQMKFLRDKDLGYQKDQVVIVSTNKPLKAGFQIAGLYRDELMKHPEVSDAAVSVFSMAETPWVELGFTNEQKAYKSFQYNSVDSRFIQTMNLKMQSGRAFSPDNPSDITSAAVVNESFVREFGLVDPIGKKLPGPFGQQIIGVVKDFNYMSLHEKIRPLLLTVAYDSIMHQTENVSFEQPPQPHISVHLKAGDIASGINVLKNVWKSVAPDQEFDFHFLDDSVASMYKAEQRTNAIVKIASSLSIFIACMGLFGLATLIVTRRTKEIGIRKVLGARTGSIVGLLSKDFIVLIIIASVIAFPIAGWFMHDWLKDFAYKSPLGWWVYPLAGLLALGVALITISFQAIRAALTNPVKSLRTE